MRAGPTGDREALPTNGKNEGKGRGSGVIAMHAERMRLPTCIPGGRLRGCKNRVTLQSGCGGRKTRIGWWGVQTKMIRFGGATSGKIKF